MATSDPRPILGRTATGKRFVAAGGELPIFGAILIAVLLLTSLPFVYATAAAPADRQFAGVIFNIPDHMQYFAWMRDLTHANLAPSRLSAEPNEPAFFNLLWWSMGRIGAALGLDYAGSYALLRIIAIFSLMAAAFGFLRLVVADTTQRLLALFLFSFGGGLGILWVGVKYLLRLEDAPFPFDIYTSEPNSFFIMLGFPHFGIALALILAMIGCFVLALRRRQYRYAVVAGVVGLMLGMQHAYDLVTIYAVFGATGLLIWLRDRRFPMFVFWCGVIIAAISVPAPAYLSALVLTDPTWGQKLSQFDNAGAWTPWPLNLLVLMGIPLLLALIGFRRRMLQSRDDTELLISVWFLLHFVLIYLPVKFQIHLLLGWQMPIAILGSAALLTRILPWLRQRAPQFAGAALASILLLATVTNVYLVAWRINDLGRHENPYYLTSGEVAALRWLEANTNGDDVVLAKLELGQFVPVWTDARSFLAHWAGTLRFFDKRDMADQVLDPGTTPSTRQAILGEYGVTYVLARDADGPTAALATASAGQLEEAFRQDGVVVFRVR
ncbi:MAG TPA: hypothetical protein PKA05_02565 [Roseiflexaceae bacterium]|nr:hypothetical protein [Roseiflexaceae bacterium]HMP39238.1 hypothetical protein [Roseiflexaceae bacterium]